MGACFISIPLRVLSTLPIPEFKSGRSLFITTYISRISDLLHHCCAVVCWGLCAGLAMFGSGSWLPSGYVVVTGKLDDWCHSRKERDSTLG